MDVDSADRRKRSRSSSSASSSSHSSRVSYHGESSRQATASPGDSPLLKHHKLDLDSFAGSSTAPDVYTCTSSPAHHVQCHLFVCDATTYFPIELPGRGNDVRTWNGRECGKVFPNERLLSLHLAECHDVETKRHQNNGKKIFGCLLPRDQCAKVCSNPKSRRLHMITAHHYPKQYYYGIVLHGLNRLLHNEGPGASMLRPLPVDIEQCENSPHVSKTLGAKSSLAPVFPRAAKTANASQSGEAVADVIDSLAALAFVPRKVKMRDEVHRSEIT